MKLLQGLQDGGALQAIRVIANEAIGTIGRGLSNKERIRTYNPGRRRWQTLPHLSSWLIYAIFLLSALAASVDATDQGGRYNRRWRSEGAIRQHEEILLDHGPTPVAVYGMLVKRQDDPSDQRSSFSSLKRPSFASTAAAVDETGTARPNVVSPSDETPSTTTRSNPPPTSVPDVPTEPSPLPKPFDGGLGTNYTQQSCPTFLRSMLSNETFSACLPLSLLLQNSVSFFAASKSKSQIEQTLDATCNVIFPACSAIMASFAQQLRSSRNCEQDWTRQNHLVTQAYNGLVAYEPLYQAGCLQGNDRKYCFANAITNTTSPSDSYVYYLPLGIPLPGPSQPSCSKCLLQTMNIFQEAAGNRSQPVTTNYVDAAQMIDVTCGPTFINATLPVALGNDNRSRASSSRPKFSSASVSGWCCAFGLILLHFATLA